MYSMAGLRPGQNISIVEWSRVSIKFIDKSNYLASHTSRMSQRYFAIQRFVFGRTDIKETTGRYQGKSVGRFQAWSTDSGCSSPTIPLPTMIFFLATQILHHAPRNLKEGSDEASK